MLVDGKSTGGRMWKAGGVEFRNRSLNFFLKSECRLAAVTVVVFSRLWPKSRWAWKQSLSFELVTRNPAIVFSYRAKMRLNPVRA